MGIKQNLVNAACAGISIGAWSSFSSIRDKITKSAEEKLPESWVKWVPSSFIAGVALGGGALLLMNGLQAVVGLGVLPKPLSTEKPLSILVENIKQVAIGIKEATVGETEAEKEAALKVLIDQWNGTLTVVCKFAHVDISGKDGAYLLMSWGQPPPEA